MYIFVIIVVLFKKIYGVKPHTMVMHTMYIVKPSIVTDFICHNTDSYRCFVPTLTSSKNLTLHLYMTWYDSFLYNNNNMLSLEMFKNFKYFNLFGWIKYI